MSCLRRGLAPLVLVAAGFVVAVLLFEAILRLTTEPTLGSGRAFAPWLVGQVVFDPIRGWRNEPGTWNGRRETAEGWAEMTYRVERHGFRGQEVADRKPEGVIRIVCMGDSATFGSIRMPAEGEALMYYSFPSYVDALRERIDREGLDHVEVINAGVIGYSSHHGLRQFMVQVRDLQPDVMTLRFGLNDVQHAWAPQHRTVEPENRLLRFLLYRFSSWRTTRVVLGVYTLPRFHPQQRSLDWSGPAEYARNLARIIERARERGIRVLLMDYPVRSSRWRKHERMQVLTRKLANGHGVPFLETGPRLLADGARGFNAHDGVHPNAYGAQLTADLLFRRLRDLGWIGHPPDRPRPGEGSGRTRFR
jgi:lysophospholipase L1-like esterase